MRKLLSIIGCVILASCGKHKNAMVDPASYRECLIGDFKESEFSKWTFGPDMQMKFDSLPTDKYWAYQEGRNYKGTWQIRWVEKTFPRDKYSTWSARCLVPAATFYDFDVKKQKQGYERISLQVFIDASGNAMHQGIWIKPLDSPVIQATPSDGDKPSN